MTTVRNNSDRTAPLPVYAVFGGDDFLRYRRMTAVIDRVLGPDRDNMALAQFDGPDAKLAEVLDECRSLSLLAPIRVVCVRDADDFVSAYRKELEKYLQAPCPTGVLILVCRTWGKTTRLRKIVEQIGRNLACDPPKPMELPRWLTNHARDAYACSLGSGVARRLIELVGNELGLLDMELAKLATFVSPRTVIEPDDVEKLVGASRIEKVFGITDAIARRDAPGALALWEQVIANDRDAPYVAVGGLAVGFRRLSEAKRLVLKGMPPARAAQKAGFWFQPDGLQRQLDRFSLHQWRDHLGKLFRIDVGSKSGLGTVRSSVEKFIVELCQAP